VIHWTAFERRWRDALLAAVIPAPPDAERPGLGALDLASFWQSFAKAAPPLLGLGLRVAVWVLTLAPLFLLGKLRLFPSLAEPQKDRLLCRALGSRLYLLRQLVVSLKAVASFAYFSDPAVRAALDAAKGPSSAPEGDPR